MDVTLWALLLAATTTLIYGLITGHTGLVIAGLVALAFADLLVRFA